LGARPIRVYLASFLAQKRKTAGGGRTGPAGSKRRKPRRGLKTGERDLSGILPGPLLRTIVRIVPGGPKFTAEGPEGAYQ